MKQRPLPTLTSSLNWEL